MPITISSPVIQTLIFAGLFFTAFLLLLRSRRDRSFFPLSLTAELKGLAILLIIFGHLGWFLFTDHKFLFPVSAASGVGVDLFLFLSGFGLAISALKKKLSFKQYFLRRFSRLYLPLWIVLIGLVILDFYILHRQYDWSVLIQTAFGYIRQADLYLDINSPLWFLTPIVFYYLLFPLFFSRRAPEVSAMLLFFAGYLVVRQEFLFLKNIQPMYDLHYWAFPLGVMFAALTQRFSSAAIVIENYLWSTDKAVTAGRLAVMAFLAFGGYIFSIHSGVGASKYVAAAMSIFTLYHFVAFFILKKTAWRLPELFGRYSYEIYLVHWPLAYRYDLIFKFLPAGVATFVYLALLLGLGCLLHRLVEKSIARLGF